MPKIPIPDRADMGHIINRPSAGFPKASRFALGRNAPPLSATEWGRELERHERELKESRRVAAPWPWDEVMP